MDIWLDNCGLLTVTYLLLIYVFVCDAAADCPKPERGENTVLTDQALLMNDFPEGTAVALECANGYEREDGAGIIKCLEGTWTESDLTCKKKDCGPPRSQPHMNFDMSAGTLFGAVLKVTCDDGFQISGSSYKQCYSTGWSGRSSCEIVTCEQPAEVTNGRSLWVSVDDPQYGDTVTYVCNTGFTLVGESSLKCGKTGEYDVPPPECRGVTTEDIIATKTIHPTATPTQEASSATDSTSAQGETSTTAAVSPSARGADVVPTADEEQVTACATSVTPSLSQDKEEETVDTNRDNEYVPIIVGVLTSGLIVSVAIAAVLCRVHLRRKGSANATVPMW